MNTKRKISSDEDILKVFRDLGLETEEAREHFRRMSRAPGLDVWGKIRNEPTITRDNTASEDIA